MSSCQCLCNPCKPCNTSTLYSSIAEKIYISATFGELRQLSALIINVLRLLISDFIANFVSIKSVHYEPNLLIHTP